MYQGLSDVEQLGQRIVVVLADIGRKLNHRIGHFRFDLTRIPTAGHFAQQVRGRADQVVILTADDLQLEFHTQGQRRGMREIRQFVLDFFSHDALRST